MMCAPVVRENSLNADRAGDRLQRLCGPSLAARFLSSYQRLEDFRVRIGSVFNVKAGGIRQREPDQAFCTASRASLTSSSASRGSATSPRVGDGVAAEPLEQRAKDFPGLDRAREPGSGGPLEGASHRGFPDLYVETAFCYRCVSLFR